jgi:hypothetical protein
MRPGDAFDVTITRGGDIYEVAWLMRRFLRGHDRIGVDRSGALFAHVFCPDEHIDEVVRRLSYIMGDRARVSFAGALEGVEASAST